MISPGNENRLGVSGESRLCFGHFHVEMPVSHANRDIKKAAGSGCQEISRDSKKTEELRVVSTDGT